MFCWRRSVELAESPRSDSLLEDKRHCVSRAKLTVRAREGSAKVGRMHRSRSDLNPFGFAQTRCADFWLVLRRSPFLSRESMLTIRVCRDRSVRGGTAVVLAPPSGERSSARREKMRERDGVCAPTGRVTLYSTTCDDTAIPVHHFDVQGAKE